MSVDHRTAPLLVLGGVVSVQFGGAFAATLVPRIGAPGSVLLRLFFAMVILYAVARPSWRGRSRSDWGTVVLFGLALAAMNTSFYASLAHLPIGVAVTIEFLGPLGLAAALSRRPRDVVAVAAAALGVVLVSGVLHTSWDRLDLVGVGFAALAGVMWAAYIVLSQRTGKAFGGLDGLALALIVSTVAVAPLGLTSVDRWTPRDVALGLGIAVLSSVLPYSLEARRAASPRAARVRHPAQPRAGRRGRGRLRRPRPGARPGTGRGHGARRARERHRARRPVPARVAGRRDGAGLMRRVADCLTSSAREVLPSPDDLQHDAP